MKIVVVDYGMGNLSSVAKKLYKIGADVLVSSKKEDIESADTLILPGVGHFGKAMENLNELDLIDVLNQEVLEKKKPILGICLGMQLMAKHSEEGNVDGLNWVDADVVRFDVSDTLKYKVPHMGWNQIQIMKESKLMNEIQNKSEFYFVHAYHLKLRDKSIELNRTEYEYSFTSSIEKENIYGVQYHPEKSHDIGGQLLKNFLTI